MHACIQKIKYFKFKLLLLFVKAILYYIEISNSTVDIIELCL